MVSSEPKAGELNLLEDVPEDEILKAIFARIAREDGPSSIDIPIV